MQFLKELLLTAALYLLLAVSYVPLRVAYWLRWGNE